MPLPHRHSCSVCGSGWSSTSPDPRRCHKCDVRRLREALPDDALAQLDELVRAGNFLRGLLLIREAAPAVFGLRLAQTIVHERRVELEVPLRPPMSEVTLESLRARLGELSEPIAAIEAMWDGDTHGWFVVLLAIVERPSSRHPKFDQEFLAILAHEAGDFRLFSGQAPPWPEAARASELGAALAVELGAAFHFSSSEKPVLQPDRWWDSSTLEP